MTVQIPAFCPHCGFIFESRLVGFGPGISVRNLMLSDNRETCPRCGQMAETAEGAFNITDDSIEILAASDLTRLRLGQLAAVLELARGEDVTQEQATAAVVEVAPSLAPLLERFGPIMQKALLVFLWAVVQVLAAQALSEHRDHAATTQDVQRAVEVAVQQCLDERP